MQLVGTRLPVSVEPAAPSAVRSEALKIAPRNVTQPIDNTATRDNGLRQAVGMDFSEVYSQNFDVAWRTLRRYGVPATELEDALQEVFLIVHDRISTFEGRSSLRTWIFGIARRVARDHRPAGRLEICEPSVMEALPASHSNGVAALAEQQEDARLLYSLLVELSPERREILVLVELEQLTVAEAAEVLDENTNTLQSRLRNAKVDLSAAFSRRQASEQWRRECAMMNKR